jgi:hypothetical protein
LSVGVIFLLGRPATTTTSHLAPIISRERRERPEVSRPPHLSAPFAGPGEGVATSESSLFKLGPVSVLERVRIVEIGLHVYQLLKAKIPLDAIGHPNVKLSPHKGRKLVPWSSIHRISLDWSIAVSNCLVGKLRSFHDAVRRFPAGLMRISLLQHRLSILFKREKRERPKVSRPPEVFAPFASGKACLPDTSLGVYRSGGSAKEGGSRCPENEMS